MSFYLLSENSEDDSGKVPWGSLTPYFQKNKEQKVSSLN